MASKDRDGNFVVCDDDEVPSENMSRYSEYRNSLLLDQSPDVDLNLRLTELEEDADAIRVRMDVLRQEQDDLASQMTHLDDSDDDRILYGDAMDSDVEFHEEVTNFIAVDDEEKRELIKKRNHVVHGQVVSTPPKTPLPKELSVRVEPPTLPGETMVSIARVLLTKDAYKRYVEPQIADIQYEYGEAISAGKKWLARYRLVRGYLLWLIPLVYALWKKLGPLWSWASK